MTDEIDERTVKAEQGSAQQSNHLSDAKKSFLGGDGGAATFAKLALSKNIDVPAYKSPVKNQSVVVPAPKTLDADSSRLGIYGKDNPMADLKKEVSAVLRLHTRQAEQLWIGRKGDKAAKVYPIWGLIQFASEIGKVWHEASLNNPVADFFLVKAEAEYEKTRKIIDSRLDELSSIIDDNDAFEEITLAENRQPIAHNLVFLCPWGYHGAGLLKKFDDIVCKAITARHVGFIDNESWQIYVHDSSRALRHFYRCCESFVDIPLERDWFTANDKKLYGAKLAYRHFGKKIPFVPAEIMSKKKRAAMCPAIRNEEVTKRFREIDFKQAKPLMAEIFAKRDKERELGGTENVKKKMKKAEAEKKSGE